MYMCMYMYMLGTNLKPRPFKAIGQFLSGPNGFEMGSKQVQWFSKIITDGFQSDPATFHILKRRGFSVQLVLCNVYGCTTPQVSCSQSGLGNILLLRRWP